MDIKNRNLSEEEKIKVIFDYFIGYFPSSLAYSVESSLSKRWNVKNYLEKDGKIFEKVKF